MGGIGNSSPLARWSCVAVGLLLIGATGCAMRRAPEGAWHELHPGETVWRVAQNYGSTVERIVRANRIADVRQVPAGMRLWVPGGRAPQGVGAGTPATIHSLWRRLGPERDEALEDARRSGELAFRWPVDGRVTSSFGRRWGREHDGLDLAARPGTPVRAAESGRVIFAAELGSYGRVVVVRHSEHYTTVYAHNRDLRVSEGDWVDKGDQIAEVGDTGRASGPHLHFEVRRWREPQDPLLYLP